MPPLTLKGDGHQTIYIIATFLLRTRIDNQQLLLPTSCHFVLWDIL